MTLSPWCLLLLAVPLLLLGQLLLRRVPLLARGSIPVPVAGGLLFALACLLLRSAGLEFSFATKVSAGWWTWLVTPDHEWLARPAKSLNLPLLVGFFTCVGLAAPLRLLASGGRMLLVLLLGTLLLALLQNTVGMALASALGAPALLGVLCGSLTLVGGHGTALGFAPRFEQAGMAAAATIGASAATVGLLAGALLAGPLGAWMLRRRMAPAARAHGSATGAEAAGGTASVPARPPVADFLADARALAGMGRNALLHLLLVAACIKAGAWISFGLDQLGATLPAYMGALLLGFAVRAAHDAAGAGWLRGDTVNRIAAVLLPLFLVVTLAPLNLGELAGVAGPMLLILGVNIALTLAFAACIVFPLLGRDREAAVAAAGLAGFGIGSTATAVAAMDAITRQYGPAPRAATIVPPCGGFLIDLGNAPVLGFYLYLSSVILTT
ncbi:sodium/glutamate symporter [Pseudoduganella sp.]|uniref:sodium/glutamate symporter n=1 Tax=Pseudoduganella sp. TaxID=1880898 RepID=UPI0035AED517